VAADLVYTQTQLTSAERGQTDTCPASLFQVNSQTTVNMS